MMNTALIPVPKLEEDSYDWYQRHQAVLALQDDLKPEIVLIGDSITHFWGGAPTGQSPRGPVAWQAAFGDRRVLNLGFGWDRTQNMLWRLENGEFKGLRPKLVIVLAGTNNTSETVNARANTPEEIAEGVVTICRRVREMSPDSRLIIMAVFPRNFEPGTPLRQTIAAINLALEPEARNIPNALFLDLTSRFLAPDGTLSAELMDDGTHPTEKGYAIWAEGLQEAGVFVGL